MLTLLIGGVQNSVAVTYIIQPIDRMEKFHTKVKEIFKYHLIEKYSSLIYIIIYTIF